MFARPVLAAGLALTTGVVVATSGIVLTGSAKADFALATQASLTVLQGATAEATVSVVASNGFKATVALSASQLPTGASAVLVPSSVSPGVTSALRIAVGSTTPTGSYPNLTVTGTSAGLTHSTKLTLVVAARPVGALTVNASPPTSTLLPGDTAAWTITTKPSAGLSGSVAISVSGLPTGAAVVVTPASAPVGSTQKLDVTTSANTPPGSYGLAITATVGTVSATTSVTLIVTTTGKDFTISAPSVVIPGPGTSQALDLGLFNPNSQSLSITNLTVGVASVSKVGPGTCTTADYAIQQFSGSYPFVVTGRSSVSLSALFPGSVWPRLVMLDPNRDQSGCKGATVKLSFSGAGHS